MSDSLRAAHDAARNWAGMLDTLNLLAELNDADHFSELFVKLIGQCREHSWTILENRERISVVAPQIVSLCGQTWPNASSAAIGVSQAFQFHVWSAASLESIVGAFMSRSDVIRFYGDVREDEPTWDTVRKAVRAFFVESTWTGGTASMLGSYVEHERAAFERLESKPKSRRGGGAVTADEQKAFRLVDYLKSQLKMDESYRPTKRDGFKDTEFEHANNGNRAVKSLLGIGKGKPLKPNWKTYLDRQVFATNSGGVQSIISTLDCHSQKLARIIKERNETSLNLTVSCEL